MYVHKAHRRMNPRFAALCLLVVFVLAGGAVWLWRGTRPLDGTNVTVPEDVRQDYLTVNRYSRPGTELKGIRGIVIHYVGNPNTTAEANRNYFESLKDGTDGVYASAHFIVGLEGEVVQCIPLTEQAYASNQRNDDTIAIEVCHPDDSGVFSDVTYDRVVALTADLCVQLHLTEKDVIRHYDVSSKECPKYYVEHPEAWKQFRNDVAAAIAEQKP
ncbi:MAG: N-acetylmuramoyl-L-alanine amidase [Oscillibacter sp.]|nr:N-acetylmuramoyl-L-alanine amidase [Oscillibacter sp.]